MDQLQLLKRAENASISIEEAESSLGVSVATIRNWIKAGHLELTGRGLVSRVSIEKFKRDFAGHNKLVARANKSFKDTHDHEALTEKFHNTLLQADEVGSHTGEQYQSSLSNAYRNREGIYYTPSIVVTRFAAYLPDEIADMTFCDPCCGSGNFVMMALRNGVKPENIYAFDVDPIAVEITKRRIRDITGYESENVLCCDFLTDSLHSQVKYDIVFTNPPWGKKLSAEEKRKFGNALSTGKSVDTCSLFYFACMSRLTDNGSLGFLLPDAFFNVATFADARRDALKHKIVALIDFDKPFKGLLTKAKAIFLKKTGPKAGHMIQCHTSSVGERSQSSFVANPKAIINFSCSNDDARVISYIYARKHITLLDAGRYGLGIVTGNNKKYVSHAAKKDHIPVFRGSDIHNGGVKSASAFIPANLSLYQQVAPVELFLAEEKLMYKFISSKLAFHNDKNQSYCLNSVNILVLRSGFPLTGDQLAPMLNSELMNWLFKNIFETHKVLRSDIEVLPIHAEYYDKYNTFDENQYLKFLGIEKYKNGTYKVAGQGLSSFCGEKSSGKKELDRTC